MSLSTLNSAPAANEIRAAYQTTLIQASGPAGDNPVVYFDVYFNSIYYRTITSTTPYARIPGTDYFQADISDVVQEYLQSVVMDLRISDITQQSGSVAKCFVKARGSNIIGGLIVPDGPAPVQGTLYSPPVSGMGYTTPTFIVLNMALQHEELSSARAALAFDTPYNIQNPGTGHYDYFPLSRNGNLNSAMDEYGWAPFLMHTNGSTSSGASARMYVYIEGHPLYYVNGAGYVHLTEERVYYLPYGLKNLQLTAGFNTLPIGNASRYIVGLEENGLGAVLIETPWIYVNRATDNHKRIFFRNYLGHYEAITFNENVESLVTNSASWQKMLATTPPSDKKLRGGNRFNVRSNEAGTLLGSFPEDQMWLLAELAASPDVYIQAKGIQGQNDDLIPIVIQDGETVILKNQERYSYDVGMKYVYANPNIHTRN